MAIQPIAAYQQSNPLAAPLRALQPSATPALPLTVVAPEVPPAPTGDQSPRDFVLTGDSGLVIQSAIAASGVVPAAALYAPTVLRTTAHPAVPAVERIDSTARLGLLVDRRV